jgi:hypothetical protein
VTARREVADLNGEASPPTAAPALEVGKVRGVAMSIRDQARGRLTEIDKKLPLLRQERQELHAERARLVEVLEAVGDDQQVEIPV